MRDLKTCRAGSKLRIAIEKFLSDHEKFSGCYFWNSPATASSRRQMEFKREHTFKFRGDIISFSQEVSCSCKNVYYSSHIEVNGEKKNIRALKKILK